LAAILGLAQRTGGSRTYRTCSGRRDSVIKTVVHKSGRVVITLGVVKRRSLGRKPQTGRSVASSVVYLLACLASRDISTRISSAICYLAVGERGRGLTALATESARQLVPATGSVGGVKTGRAVSVELAGGARVQHSIGRASRVHAQTFPRESRNAARIPRTVELCLAISTVPSLTYIAGFRTDIQGSH